MNRLIALKDGERVAECEIHTGAHKSARRVPLRFVWDSRARGADSYFVDTARGWKPRRIVQVGNRFFTREEVQS